ncbi:MAG: radical SAM protein [Bacillota bacterium]|nr:radical SAM protein [Bacillota bacterium]
MELEALILKSAQQYNILPVTSRCNVQCIFCSHKNNPRGIKVVSCAYRPLEKVLEALDFLDPNQKIVIGESTTRIIEGEPFSHPDILEILKQVRGRFSTTPLYITTNGNNLTEKVVEQLAELMPIELTISLNSSNIDIRRMIMGADGSGGIEAIALLQKFQIPYHGSIVAMPWRTGWLDLEQTVKTLNHYGAQTVRIFLPGYTNKTEANLRFNSELWPALNRWIEGISGEITTTLLLEPPLITDLDARIKGVLANTAAQKSGFLPEDILLEVGGNPVNSRVDGFRLLEKAGTCTIKVARQGQEFSLKLDKKPGERSGIVVDFDVDLAHLQEVEYLLNSRRLSKGIILTSKLAEPLLKLGYAKLGLAERIAIYGVPSLYFGGSIKAAGLLVVEDFIQFLKANSNMLGAGDLLILPAVAFDSAGMDLVGRYYWELEEYLQGKDVMIC